MRQMLYQQRKGSALAKVVPYELLKSPYHGLDVYRFALESAMEVRIILT